MIGPVISGNRMIFSSASLMVDVNIAAMVALPEMAMERSQYTSVPVAEMRRTYLGSSSSAVLVMMMDAIW